MLLEAVWDVFLLLKIMSNCYVWRQISFNKMFYCNKLWRMAHTRSFSSGLSLSLALAPVPPLVISFYILWLGIFFLKARCGPINVSSMFSVGVCQREKDGRGERERIRWREKESGKARGWVAALFSAHVPHQQCSACNGWPRVHWLIGVCKSSLAFFPSPAGLIVAATGPESVQYQTRRPGPLINQTAVSELALINSLFLVFRPKMLLFWFLWPLSLA